MRSFKNLGLMAGERIPHAMRRLVGASNSSLGGFKIWAVQDEVWSQVFLGYPDTWDMLAEAVLGDGSTDGNESQRHGQDNRKFLEQTFPCTVEHTPRSLTAGRI